MKIDHLSRSLILKLRSSKNKLMRLKFNTDSRKIQKKDSVIKKFVRDPCPTSSQSERLSKRRNLLSEAIYYPTKKALGHRTGSQGVAHTSVKHFVPKNTCFVDAHFFEELFIVNAETR